MANTAYMEWVKPLVLDFLHTSLQVKQVLFIPFAGVTLTWDDYAGKVQQALPPLKIVPIHKCEDFQEAVRSAQAIMIGGGNTFHLLYKLYEYQLLDLIRDRVNAGTPYVGWSAGSNVACPDIGTTNDMPIIFPPSDRALNLVPYNLNPHYNQWKPENYKGEGRDDRLNECVVVKRRPIVAIAEGVGIEVQNGEHRLLKPSIPLHCFGPGGDNRQVKVWYIRESKAQVADIAFDSKLCQQIDSLA